MANDRDEEIRRAVNRLYNFYVDALTTPPGSSEAMALDLIRKDIERELTRLGFTDSEIVSLDGRTRAAVQATFEVRAADLERVAAKPVRQPKVPNLRLEEVRSVVRQSIRRSEMDSRITLTKGGRQMLTIPAIEIFELTGDWNPGLVSESIAKIVDAAKSSGLGTRLQSSLDVIRGYAKTYCRIPPFCGRTQENEEQR